MNLNSRADFKKYKLFLLTNKKIKKSKKYFLKHLDRLTSVLLDNPHIAGYCYTQLYDVEGETNGIYTYDRELKFSKRALKKIFAVPAAMEAD